MRFVIPAAGGRDELVIEAPAAANLNYFLKTALTPVNSSNATVKTVSVKAHSRRQYPGDTTPSAVVATNREYLADAGRKSGNSLGGFTFTLAADYGLPAEERRRFTLVKGDLVDLHAFLVGQAKYETYLWTKNGARYIIDAAGTT